MKGGSKLLSNENKFSFELNELLYLEKGQEVAEMMQISLDPEISIQPYHDYISIRGAIQLQGAYRKAETNGEIEEDRNGFDNRRFMQQVTDMRAGEASFSHSFPVEISVPTYRVDDFNDIAVNIASFDYEIPDENQLKLNAIIDIYGIRMEDNEPTYMETTQEDEMEVGTRGGQEFQQELEYTPLFEDSDAQESIHQSSQEPVDEQETVTPTGPDIVEQEMESLSGAAGEVNLLEQRGQKQANAPTEEDDKDQLQQIPEIPSAAPNDEEQEETASLTTTESRDSAFQAEKDTALEQLDNEEESNFQFDIKETEAESQPTENEIGEHNEVSAVSTGRKNSSPVEAEKDRWQKKSQTLAEFFNNSSLSTNEDAEAQIEEEAWIESSSSSSDIDFESSSSSYESLESSSDEAVTDVRYLADMFSKEDEEEYTQLRLCIVQHKDTIETIAERYQVPTLQILKQNQLDGDNLAEGQLLYIPAKRKKK